MSKQRLFSADCCGGIVLTLTTLCLSVGVLFLAVSATLPGLIFIAVGLIAEGLCLGLSRTRCTNRIASSKYG